MKKIFVDHREIEAPFGVFSRDELEALFSARGKRGNPLGRNAIRLWLFLVNRASGRVLGDAFEVNLSCIKEIIPKESSRYEAFNDLLHSGFIVNFHSKKCLWSLTIPNPEKTEESIKSNSEKTKGKLPETKILSESTPLIHKKQLQEKPPIPQKGGQDNFIKGDDIGLMMIIRDMYIHDSGRLCGSLDRPEWENRKILLEQPPERLVRLACHGVEGSLLRLRGYIGPLRKRSLIGPFRAVLEEMEPIPEPSPISPSWERWISVVDYFSTHGDIDNPNKWMKPHVMPPSDLREEDITSIIEPELQELALKIWNRYQHAQI